MLAEAGQLSWGQMSTQPMWHLEDRIFASRNAPSGQLSPQHDPRAVNEKRYRCPREGCGRSYTSSSSLSRHMQVHTGKFSFFCEHCQKGFNERTNYDQHMTKHEGRPSLNCQICNKKVLNEQKLRDHMLEAHKL